MHAISTGGPGLVEFGEVEGVCCHAVAMERRITPARDLVAVAQIVRALRAIGATIVDAHTPKAGLLGMIAARAAGVPVRIYHLHGLRYATTQGPVRALLKSTERLAASLATRVVCVSRSVAEVAVHDGVVPREKITVLLGGSINGVDAERPLPARRRRGAARRADRSRPPARRAGDRVRRSRGPREGRRRALGGMARPARRAPDARLVLVGPREPHDPIPPDVAAGLEGDPRVTLAGRDRDTVRWFRAMDVVALPSWREGFPVVPLEAAAMAVPVVATQVPGCVDAVVDGVTGRLVPPRDPTALAAALRAYLGDPGLRARHGAAARARVLAEFEQRRIWAALHGEYLSAITEAGAAARSEARAPTGAPPTP